MLFGTNLFYLVGIKMLGATPAAVWQSSLPIFTMLMAVLVGYEYLTVLKVLGVLCAFSGCAFVSLYSSGSDRAGESTGDSNQLMGNVIFLVQVSACAGFFVAEKPLLRRFSPLATLAYCYGIASSLMLAAALIVNSSPPLLDAMCPDCNGQGWGVPPKACFAIAYWVFLGSICGYYLLTWGNLYVDATIVGAYFTVQPLAAVAASMLVISLTPPPHFHLEGPGVSDLGAIGIFLGVGLLIYDARQQGQTLTNCHGAAMAAEADAPCAAAPDRSPTGRRVIGTSVSHDNVFLAVRMGLAAQQRTARSTDAPSFALLRDHAPGDEQEAAYRPPTTRTREGS